MIRRAFPLAAVAAFSGLLAAACGCTSSAGSVTAPMPPPVETGKSFTLAIGETASPSPSLVVKFVSVTEDSRCPKGEQCVWAGNARVVLEVSVSGGSPSSVTLDTNPSRGASEVEIADRFLVLEGLAPLPVTGRTIGASDYRVTLSVQPR